MSKFCNNYKEYTFSSFDEMIHDIVLEYEESKDVEVMLSWDEVPRFMIALLSINTFNPAMIEWNAPEFDEYDKEYSITLSHFGEDNVFIEKCWNQSKGRYFNALGEGANVIFASQNISKSLYDNITYECGNVVLFDFED